MNFPQNFLNFDRNSGKTIQNLAKFWNSQEFESAGFGILHKLLLSFLEILKFLGTHFSVVYWRGGGGGNFLEKPIEVQ